MDCSKTARRHLGDKYSYQRHTKFESRTLDGGEGREKHQFDIFSAAQLVAGSKFFKSLKNPKKQKTPPRTQTNPTKL